MPTRKLKQPVMTEIDGVGWIAIRKRRADKYIGFAFFFGTAITVYELFTMNSMAALIAGAVMMSVAAAASTVL
jgi:hypothetical protein